MPDDTGPTAVGAPHLTAAAPAVVDAPGRPERPRPPRRGALRVTAAVATVGIVAALVGIGILLLPVRTPLQDCGTSMNFLLKGRTDTFADPSDPPKGTTKADVEANNEKPCHERVADKGRVAVVAIGIGLVVGIVSAAVEIAVRWRIHRRSRRTQHAPAAP